MKPFHVLAACVLPLASGCTSPWAVRSQSPEEDASGSPVKFVGDVAFPFGRNHVVVEGVGLVVDLHGTGSKPGPTVYRQMLEAEMHKLGIENFKAVLSSPDTALVLVRGRLSPGVQKGDRFDLELRIPDRSETKSLRGGRLLEVRLTESAVAGGQVRVGHLEARGAGPVLTADTPDDPVSAVRGRVLGGGVALKSHGVGLVLRGPHRSVHYSAAVGAAINRRFYTYKNGIQQKTANPLNNEYIELNIHGRYVKNVPRFLSVVQNLPLRESATERLSRIELLQRQLLDPLTASTAALRLEAIGHEGAAALLKGIASNDPEVRFYSAEALAYLDHEESPKAAAALAEAARTVPAFRVFALTALSTINEIEAHEQLRELLNERSAETRYGAFRALWAMNENHPLVRGEMLGGQFTLHSLDVSGPPMIHLTRSFRPEIVLFGHEQRFQTPLLLDAGDIMVNAEPGGPVKVSRFAVNQPVEKRQVTPRVEEVIRAVVELGGKYPDVVQLLQQAAASGALADGSRLEVDALPQGGRRYFREVPEEPAAERFAVPNPLPNLFGAAPKQALATKRRRNRSSRVDPPENDSFFTSMFDRMQFWR